MSGSAHTIFKGVELKKVLSKKIVKNQLFHGKCLLNKFFGLCTHPKTSFYAFFMPQNKTKSQKRLLKMCLPSLTAAAFSPTSRWGGGWVAVGVGGKPLNRAKVRSRQKWGRLFADCQPHRPLSIFCLK